MKRLSDELRARTEHRAITDLQVYWRGIQARVSEHETAQALDAIGACWRGEARPGVVRPSSLPELRIASVVAKTLRAIDARDLDGLSTAEAMFAELMRPAEAFEARAGFFPLAPTPLKRRLRRFWPFGRRRRRLEEAWLAESHDRIALLRSLAACARFELAYDLEHSDHDRERDIEWYRAQAEEAFSTWPHDVYPLVAASEIARARGEHGMALDLSLKALAIQDSASAVRNQLARVTLPALAQMSELHLAPGAAPDSLPDRLLDGLKSAAQHAVQARLLSAQSVAEAEDARWARFDHLLDGAAASADPFASYATFWFALALCRRATVLWQSDAGAAPIDDLFATAADMLETVARYPGSTDGAENGLHLRRVAGREAAAAAAARVFLARERGAGEAEAREAFDARVRFLRDLEDVGLDADLKIIEMRTADDVARIVQGDGDLDESRLSVFVPDLNARIVGDAVADPRAGLALFASEAYAPIDEIRDHVDACVRREVFEPLGIEPFAAARLSPVVIGLDQENDAEGGGRFVILDSHAVKDEGVLRLPDPRRVWPARQEGLFEMTSVFPHDVLPILASPPPAGKAGDRFAREATRHRSGRDVSNADAWLDFVSARIAWATLDRLVDHLTLDDAVLHLASASASPGDDAARLFALLRLLIRDRTPLDGVRELLAATPIDDLSLPVWRLNATLRAHPRMLPRLWGVRTQMESLVIDGVCPIEPQGAHAGARSRRLAARLAARLKAAVDARAASDPLALRIVVETDACRETLARGLRDAGLAFPVLTLGEVGDVEPKAFAGAVSDFWDGLE